MARPSDLNRKHKSGISYARAAKMFGVDVETVRQYAQQVKQFNKESRAAAKAYGYKGDYRTAWSLSEIARQKEAAERFGGFKQAFQYQMQDVRARMADSVSSRWAQAAEQYAANVKSALTGLPESAFPESNVSKALRALDKLSARQIMRATGGMFFDDYGSPGRGTTSKDAPDREGHPIILSLIRAGRIK